MGGDRFFWLLFGSIWLVVGAGFLATSLGVHWFADPSAIDDSTPLWVFMAAGAAALAAGGFIVRRTLLAVRRERRLMASGVLVTATVVDLRRSAIDINRQARWHVRYRYAYSANSMLEGESPALAGEAVQRYVPGGRVAIKVDPQHPEDSLFLGAAGGV